MCRTCFFYGVLRTQVTFSSKIDVKLAVGDFIQLFGFAKLFRVTRIDNTVNVSTVTSGAINDEKPYIKGASIVAISWPFRRPVAPLPGGIMLRPSTLADLARAVKEGKVLPLMGVK